MLYTITMVGCDMILLNLALLLKFFYSRPLFFIELPLTQIWGTYFCWIFTSPVSPVFHTVVIVSWSQSKTKDDDIHSIILYVHVLCISTSKRVLRMPLACRKRLSDIITGIVGCTICMSNIISLRWSKYSSM